MTRLIALLFVLIAGQAQADGATLYRWTDASGVTRYGYQPPGGVAAEPAEEERRELYENPNAPPIQCRDLAEQHIALIDGEIARVKAMKAGLGAAYELTPSARQALVMDLLAHRAALITGRSAAEFRTPTQDEVLRAANRLQGENQKLQGQVRAQESTISTQESQIKDARRQNAAEQFLWRPWGPGYYPMTPVPIRRH